MKRILVIEDDPAIAELERDFLEINGYEVTIAGDGHQGLKDALAGGYRLILLDLMLPGVDGIEICRRIRPQLDIPILMVTARAEEVDRLRGLGIGADDYIVKPFSPPELVARVKANIAQYDRLSSRGNSGAERDRAEITIGGLRLNYNSRRVFLDEAEIECKNKEYEMLYFLMSNPDIVFSKEKLYEEIWGMDAYGDIKTVAVHINRLRDKIEKDPASPQRIQTVWGAGYRFKI